MLSYILVLAIHPERFFTLETLFVLETLFFVWDWLPVTKSLAANPTQQFFDERPVASPPKYTMNDACKIAQKSRLCKRIRTIHTKTMRNVKNRHKIFIKMVRETAN